MSDTDYDAPPAFATRTDMAVIETAEKPRPPAAPTRPTAPYDASSPMLMFDPMRFEMCERVANVMAMSALCPEHLQGYYIGQGNGRTFKAYPLHTVKANCFLVVDQAYSWGMSPFLLAQCTSIVRGRLMYEGKVIAAVIESQLGTRLDYQFSGQGESMSVIVTGKRRGDEHARAISGTVAAWKTTHKGTPWTPANYERQLAYRGAREWARRWAPALILGIVTDDENLDDDRRQPQQTIEQAKPIALSTGFASEGAKSAPAKQTRKTTRMNQPRQEETAASDTETAAEIVENVDDGGEDAGEAEQEGAQATAATESEKAPDSSTEGRETVDSATGDGGEEIDQTTPEEKARSVYAEALHGAQSWNAISMALSTFFAAYTAAGVKISMEDAISARRSAYNQMLHLFNGGHDMPDLEDVAWFRCLVTGCDNPETIKGAWNVFQVGDAYGRMRADDRKAVKATTMKRIDALEGRT